MASVCNRRFSGSQEIGDTTVLKTRINEDGHWHLKGGAINLSELFATFGPAFTVAEIISCIGITTVPRFYENASMLGARVNAGKRALSVCWPMAAPAISRTSANPGRAHASLSLTYRPSATVRFLSPRLKLSARRQKSLTTCLALASSVWTGFGHVRLTFDYCTSQKKKENSKRHN